MTCRVAQSSIIIHEFIVIEKFIVAVISLFRIFDLDVPRLAFSIK